MSHRKRVGVSPFALPYVYFSASGVHTVRVADIDVFFFFSSLELIEAFQPLSSTHDEL